MDIETLVDTYGAAWSAPDDETRSRLLHAAWADDGRYQDPNSDVQGRDALDAHIAGFQSRFPGARIERVGAAANHHGAILFRWRIVARDGTALLSGQDYAELDGNGRITKIVGFFDTPT